MSHPPESYGARLLTLHRWIFGTNVPNKRFAHALTFYFGGMKSYREKLASEANSGYEGFAYVEPGKTPPY